MTLVKSISPMLSLKLLFGGVLLGAYVFDSDISKS